MTSSSKSELPPKGAKVSLDVTWHNGSTSRMTGIVIHVNEKETFVETSRGPVVGPTDSVEIEES